jgi:PEP-CTERM motif
MKAIRIGEAIFRFFSTKVWLPCALLLMALPATVAHASWEWEFTGDNALANGGAGTGTYGGNSWFNLNNWGYYVDNAINQTAQVTTDSATGYLLYGSIQNANGAGMPPWITSNSAANPPPLVNDPTNAFGFGAYDGQLFPYALSTSTGPGLLNATLYPPGKSQIDGSPMPIFAIPSHANVLPFGDTTTPLPNGTYTTFTFIGIKSNDYNHQNFGDSDPAHPSLNPSQSSLAIFDPANDTANTTPDDPTTPNVNEHLQFTAGRIYVGGTTGGVVPFQIGGVDQPTVQSGTLDIRSGTLVMTSDLQLGRGGAKINGGGVTGKLIINGGSLLLNNPTNFLNLVLGPVNPNVAGQPASVGRGIIEYHKGVLRLAPPQSVDTYGNVTGGGTLTVASAYVAAPDTADGYAGATESKIAMYNDGPGYFRVNNLTFAGGNATAAGVGITGPVMATAEFHFNNGGVRPIQVANNLTLNNGTVVDTSTDPNGVTVASRRSRLNLVLDAVPTVTAGVPQNLGLIDVDSGINPILDDMGNPTALFDSNGNGTGAVNSGGTFYNTDNVTQLTDGATVSAIYGNTQYNWKIHYNGKITWGSSAAGATVADYSNSTIFKVDWQDSPPDGTYKDVVLVGDSSQTSLIKGDLDRDGHVSSSDLQAMVTALTGLGAYAATKHLTLAELSQIGDVNSSGSFTNADLQALLTLLANGGGSATAVPEPSALLLSAMGAMAGLVIAIHKRRRSAGRLFPSESQ